MNHDPSDTWEVRAARPEEWVRSFEILFQQLSPQQRQDQVANALALAKRRELDGAGIVVLRDRQQVLGTMLCLPIAGAGGLVWPPQTISVDAGVAVEDRLVQHALQWLWEQGAKVAQALLPPEEVTMGAPLERNGFGRITQLWYLRHNLERSASQDQKQVRLRYETYRKTQAAQFHQTLLTTYVESLDCPELTGVRSIDEIIAGHLAQGIHNPDLWWLALDGDQPAGVLLLAMLPESRSCDVSYLGVVPDLRQRGLGLELATKALIEARAAGAAQLTLSVDSRNQAARNLYRKLGFEPYGQREVYLAVLGTRGVTSSTLQITSTPP